MAAVAERGGEPPKSTNVKDVPCYFHSASRYGAGKGCSKGVECPFSHSKFLSRQDFDAAERPRSASASRRTGKGGGKGQSSSRTPGKRLIPFHCNKFLRDGTCPFEEKEGKPCKYPHLNREQYDAELAKMKAAAAAAPAK